MLLMLSNLGSKPFLEEIFFFLSTFQLLFQTPNSLAEIADIVLSFRRGHLNFLSHVRPTFDCLWFFNKLLFDDGCFLNHLILQLKFLCRFLADSSFRPMRWHLSFRKFI